MIRSKICLADIREESTYMEIERKFLISKENLPELKNIKIVQLEAEASFFPKWTQVHFQKYVIKNRRLSLDFSNTCPFFSPGIEYIHDIFAKLSKN